MTLKTCFMSNLRHEQLCGSRASKIFDPPSHSLRFSIVWGRKIICDFQSYLDSMSTSVFVARLHLFFPTPELLQKPVFSVPAPLPLPLLHPSPPIHPSTPPPLHHSTPPPLHPSTLQVREVADVRSAFALVAGVAPCLRIADQAWFFAS